MTFEVQLAAALAVVGLAAGYVVGWWGRAGAGGRAGGCASGCGKCAAPPPTPESKGRFPLPQL